MRDPAPLLAAICENPDDVVSRLAYADWLEENGDSEQGAIDRAELIRLQISLSGADPDDPSFRARIDRERVLRKRLNPRLKAEVRAGRDAVYHHGFIEGLTLTIEEFLQQAPGLFARTPLRQVRFIRLVGSTAPLNDLLASPWLARLRAIEFAYFDFRGEGARRLAECPHLARLQALDFLHGELHTIPRAVAESAVLTNLRALHLRHGISGQDVAALAGSPNLAQLEELTLGATTGGVQTLAGSPHLRRLRVLNLNRQIGAAGIEALVRSTALAGLERLLHRAGLGAEEARAFSASTHPGRLRWLLLGERYSRNPGLGDSGAEALAAAPWLAELRVLHLPHNGIGPAGARALAATSHFDRLHTLGLAGNPIGDQGAQVLAESPHLGRVRSLRLRGCRIGSTGAKALAASAWLPPLDLLELRDNPIRAAGLRALHERFGAAVRIEEKS